MILKKTGEWMIFLADHDLPTLRGWTFFNQSQHLAGSFHYEISIRRICSCTFQAAVTLSHLVIPPFLLPVSPAAN